ncbi:hypothetical protein [Xanthomonas axonopodis]|uniref:Uncharacterized protein n=1 Tax=Xanthomonas axonopodis pv. vasculorum TaxID=325777 RepID=A0A098PXQ1_9XANT|nr:hypothetical protein [Xanthomonas axonopodis]KGE51358.1 hypothetical protein GW15_0215090 [Xanthomonas axonopodis pv. vasculorum]PPV07899.1 hypothetical protein XavaCFBP5823_18390 [Xanthomonas axonopodis pv. vasculorum]
MYEGTTSFIPHDELALHVIGIIHPETIARRCRGARPGRSRAFTHGPSAVAVQLLTGAAQGSLTGDPLTNPECPFANHSHTNTAADKRRC